MKTTKLEETKSQKTFFWIFTIGIALLTIVAMSFRFQQSKAFNDENFKATFENEVVLRAFFAADRITSESIRVINCTGDDKLIVTCKATGKELHIIKFRATLPISDFSIHVARDNDILDIRTVTGLPANKDNPDIEKFLDVFKNPISN